MLVEEFAERGEEASTANKEIREKYYQEYDANLQDSTQQPVSSIHKISQLKYQGVMRGMTHPLNKKATYCFTERQ